MSNNTTIDDTAEIERIEFKHKEANEMVPAMRKKLFRSDKKFQKWIAVLKEKNAINDQGAHGFTLLMHAVMTLRPNIITMLVENGADPTIPSNNGLAPVHVAAELDKPIYLESLLINKEVANSTNPNHSFTPLHNSVKGVRKDNIILLLDMGADINAQSNVGNTPLNIALSPTDFETARLLLRRGADPFIKNTNNVCYMDHLLNWNDDRNILTDPAKAELDKTIALVRELQPERQ